MYEKNKTGGKLKTVGQDHDTSKFGFLDEIGKKKEKTRSNFKYFLMKFYKLMI